MQHLDFQKKIPFIFRSVAIGVSAFCAINFSAQAAPDPKAAAATAAILGDFVESPGSPAKSTAVSSPVGSASKPVLQGNPLPSSTTPVAAPATPVSNTTTTKRTTPLAQGNPSPADKPAQTSGSSSTSFVANVSAPSKARISSAKTVRELIEIDDQIALSKQKTALLIEQAKEKENNLVGKKSATDVGMDKAMRQAAVAQKKAEEEFRSSVALVSLIGIEGERRIQLTVGGAPYTLIEGSSRLAKGYVLRSINGPCITVTRPGNWVEPVPQKSPAEASKSVAKSQSEAKTSRKGTVVKQKPETVKTACFNPAPEPVKNQFAMTGGQGMPNTSIGMRPGGMNPLPPVPIPMPVQIPGQPMFGR